jgi:hypothetical protein
VAKVALLRRQLPFGDQIRPGLGPPGGRIGDPGVLAALDDLSEQLLLQIEGCPRLFHVGPEILWLIALAEEMCETVIIEVCL